MNLQMILCPDYLYSINQFLTIQDTNSLALSCTEVFNLLMKTDYKNVRESYTKHVEEYPKFKNQLMTNLKNNCTNPNQLNLVFRQIFYDFPRTGIGYYDNQFVYFSNDREMIVKKFRYTGDLEDEDDRYFESYELYKRTRQPGEEFSYIYFDITKIEDEIVMKFLYLSAKFCPNLFGSKTGFKTWSIDCQGYNELYQNIHDQFMEYIDKQLPYLCISIKYFNE